MPFFIVFLVLKRFQVPSSAFLKVLGNLIFQGFPHLLLLDTLFPSIPKVFCATLQVIVPTLYHCRGGMSKEL